MRYFPVSDESMQAALMEELLRICHDAARLFWLVARAAAIYSDWCGVAELRAIYSDRWAPSEGPRIYSSIYPSAQNGQGGYPEDPAGRQLSVALGTEPSWLPDVRIRQIEGTYDPLVAQIAESTLAVRPLLADYVNPVNQALYEMDRQISDEPESVDRERTMRLRQAPMRSERSAPIQWPKHLRPITQADVVEAVSKNRAGEKS